MSKPKTLKGIERKHLIDELYRKYATSATPKKKVWYLRKKYSWLLVVEGTKILKRLIDIVSAIILLILLFPLMLIIASLIKIHDKGPILYITNRVGKWGKEFRFPKFRTMKIDAEQMLEALEIHNENPNLKRFKIKKDPRITWIGAILRKTSLDELPQLWCVFKGDMSLVGPRPPLPKEVALYSLDERRRLEITPGLTCIWQVSGRSDIPFDKQVQLDIQYIESQSFWLDIKLLLKTIPAVILGKGAY